ncbi:MAG: DUF1365 domain-containing protein [Candidatus Dormibacteraeota bacterium]|nr:DUF1365 domain-containing protein [Candidatus Dormibacteraeota bacterium]
MIRHSCIYQGSVHHRRRTPVEHSFRYRVFMLYLDLDELEDVFAHRLLWSTARPALARWRRIDYPGDPSQPLDAWVRALVAERTGDQLTGPVRLLTHCRYMGTGFNPISVYYCFDSDGETLQWAVLEVTSTPWGERTHYVVDMRGDARVRSGRMPKALHVSPFLPMALEYRWRLSRPGASVAVAIDVTDGSELVLQTGIAMRRRPLSHAIMAGLLLRHPPMSLRVLGGIYWQALHLWRKRVPYHRRPHHLPEESAAA